MEQIIFFFRCSSENIKPPCRDRDAKALRRFVFLRSFQAFRICDPAVSGPGADRYERRRKGQKNKTGATALQQSLCREVFVFLSEL